MTVLNRVLIVFAVFALLLYGGGAGAAPPPPAAPAPAAAPPDSIPTGRIIDTTVVFDRFAPTSMSYVVGNETAVGLGSRLNTTMNAGKGWTLFNSLQAEKRRYRGRDMEDVNQNVSIRASQIREALYTLDFSVGKSYSRKTTMGLGRYGKAIIYNNDNARLDYALSRPLLGATQSLLTVGAGLRRGQDDFKYDRSISGNLSGALNYTIGDVVGVSGGFGTNRSTETSEIGSTNFGAMPSNGDTLRGAFNYGRGEAKIFAINFSQSHGIERSVMPPLGNSLEILDDPSKAQKEEVRQKGEELAMTSNLQPFSFLAMDFQFRHAAETQQYAVDKRLSMDRKNTDLSANANYRYAQSGSMSVQISLSESTDDYGPLSLSSYKERGRTIGMSVSQKISDSLSVNLSGTSYLKQRYFTKQDVNPRDADFLYYHGEAVLRAAPVRRITADVTLAADRYETINIDGTLSGDNRVDYQYRVGPLITLKPARWITLSQDYTVKIEYTDFVYTEDKNYLNRTTTLNTTAGFMVVRPLAFNIRHSYLMKDTGSYLTRNGEQLYNPSNENREQSLFFDLRYTPLRDLTVKAQADFRNQRNNVFGVLDGQKAIVGSTLSQSGGLRVGFVRNRRIGSLGTVNLDVSYVRRYGPYMTEERRRYWDVNSNITLKF